jgi:hypothetical protein
MRNRVGTRSVVEGLVGGEGLAELPPSRGNVQELNVLPTGAGNGEAESLAYKRSIGLPVGAPVPGHLDPPRVGVLDPRAAHGPAAVGVLDADKLEVVAAGDDEARAAGARALDKLVQDWHNPSSVDADVVPRWLRHVEVQAQRVAPSAVVAGQRVVGRAQVGGRHDDRVAGLAPLPAMPRRVTREGVAVGTSRTTRRR